MNRTFVLRLLLAGSLAVGIAIPIVLACAPEGPTLAFTWANHPDLPLNAFAAGRLGVLQPTYARSYLVVAYRYLSGLPLTKNEQRGALDLWEERLGGGVRRAPVPPGPKAPDPAETLVWKKVRARFTREPAPEPIAHRWVKDFYAAEVSESALEVAAETLVDRSKRWPPDQLVDWIKAQDIVFSADPKSGHPPQAPPAGAGILFRQDRAYQLASAKFYMEDYEGARKGYLAIREDPASPWRRLASYLIGRAWFREGDRSPAPDHASRCFLEAFKVFKGLREGGLPSRGAGPAPEPIPEADLTEAILLGEYQARSRVDPEGAADQLVAGLLGKAAGAGFGVDLGRYTFLLDRQIHGEADTGEDQARKREIPAGLLKQDLTEWAYRFRDTGPAAYKIAYLRWRGRRTAPWLLMALANGEPSSSGVTELLAAAAQIKEGHAGFESLAFHRARLLIGLGRSAEAMPLMAHFLDGSNDTVTPSSMNLWRALRLPLAEDHKGFLADVLRVPAGSYDYRWRRRIDPSKGDLGLTTRTAGCQAGDPEVKDLLKGIPPPPRFLQADGTRILNTKTPVEVLFSLAMDPTVPSHLAREWLRAAWVRSVLLEKWEIAAKVMPHVLDREPELKPLLGGFSQAPPSEQARLALMAIASHPGLRWMVYPGINHRTFTWPGSVPVSLRHRDTFMGACWWPGHQTREKPDEGLTIGSWRWGSVFWYPQSDVMEQPLFALAGARSAELGWLGPDQRKQGQAEARALLDLPEAPDWIAEKVLGWARTEPEDPRIPEALHYAVVAEKVGGEMKLGAKCFKLLHSRYRSSPWARKTPIHY